jgi:hypothetical protein
VVLTITKNASSAPEPTRLDGYSLPRIEFLIDGQSVKIDAIVWDAEGHPERAPSPLHRAAREIVFRHQPTRAVRVPAFHDAG